MINQEWAIRTAVPKDIPFIYSTWLQSYFEDSSLGGSIDRSSIYYENYKLVIDHILASKTSNTLIACLNNDPDVILGYLVKESNTAHYCFVKESFRKLGVAKSLFSKDGFLIRARAATHKTKWATDIMDRFGLDFNPFLLYQRQGEV